ncbi:MAG: ATP synthase F0 subunit A [Acidobacteria bacterium]|nr:MAG: ATP synthase F0 subunit A [Acidobacteriota bacterium]
MMWPLMNVISLISEEVPEGGQAAEHHVPIIVEWVNHLLGPAVYRIQEAIMPTVYGWFGAEWHGHPEMPIPTHMVMFFIAVIISTVGLRWMIGELSIENPSNRQQFFEVIFEGVRNLMRENIGPHYMRYFPVIGLFTVLIGVSNLMGMIPFLRAPTANYNIPFALAVLSFLYYNYVGIKENGLLGHLRHFAGPVLFVAVIFFPIEIVSNLARILSLSMRLFWNIFGDDISVEAFAQIMQYGFPMILLPLRAIVAVMQTFIFMYLSIIYISEVTHHEEKHEVSITTEQPAPVAA